MQSRLSAQQKSTPEMLNLNWTSLSECGGKTKKTVSMSLDLFPSSLFPLFSCSVKVVSSFMYNDPRQDREHLCIVFPKLVCSAPCNFNYGP